MADDGWTDGGVTTPRCGIQYLIIEVTASPSPSLFCRRRWIVYSEQSNCDTEARLARPGDNFGNLGKALPRRKFNQSVLKTWRLTP